MKTIGFWVASSVASAEYYLRINESVNTYRGGHGAAEIVLYSVDFGVIEGFIRTRAMGPGHGLPRRKGAAPRARPRGLLDPGHKYHAPGGRPAIGTH